MSGQSFQLSLDGVGAVSWAITGVALVLTGGRYYIRWELLGGFRSDDIAHLVAVLFMIGQIAMYSGQLGELKKLVAFGKDPKHAPKPDLPALMGGSTADGFILITGLWAVKVAYMLLYRNLFSINKKFNRAWWVAMVYHALTYAVCVIGRLIYCGGQPSQLLNFKVCGDKRYVPLLRSIYVFMYVAIVSSDLVTMALPLGMLRGLKMRASQKATIGVVLCLSVVVIVFDTLRLAEAYTSGSALNTLWQNLELEVAVIVSALPAYYSLGNWRRGYYTSSNARPSNQRFLLSNSRSSQPSRSHHAPQSQVQTSSYVHQRGSMDRDLDKATDVRVDVQPIALRSYV